MAASNIKRMRERIEHKIDKLNKELENLQNVCTHRDLTYKLRGDSGNWDRADDAYWIEWHCHDCDKRWTTSQDNVWHQTNVVYPHAKRV